jgi:lipid II:glycine glycyltransferase (peptidoglycan interpeptide bridge formation enzyme)
MMEVRSAITGRRGVCLPFSDSCAPLGFDAHEFKLVEENVRNTALEQRWKYYELRGGDELMAPEAFPATTFYSHSLSLTSPEEDLWRRCSSAVRRGIRRATKNGLKTEVGVDRNSVLEFFKLHGKTRRRHGLPPQPLAFFISIYEEVINRGHGFVVLARKGTRVIAGAVFFKFGRNALYKFGASDAAFQEFRGNNLTMWEGMKTLAASQCQRLDFGRTSPDNEGLRHFKMGWGATEGKLNYFVYDMVKRGWKKRDREGSAFHHRIFGSMPLSFNRVAGALAYRHLD